MRVTDPRVRATIQSGEPHASHDSEWLASVTHDQYISDRPTLDNEDTTLRQVNRGRPVAMIARLFFLSLEREQRPTRGAYNHWFVCPYFLGGTLSWVYFETVIQPE